ncbi:MAG: transposase [Facklamia hominis]
MLSQKTKLKNCVKRKKDVEPVFGQFKQNLKFRRTHLRGKKKVNTDIGLVLMANNLIKVRNRTK